jgi:hypothetical protein
VASKLLGDLAELCGLRPARAGHQDVQAALFVEDRREQPVQVGTVGDITGDGHQPVPDQRFRLVQLAFATAHDEDVRAFVDEPLRRRQADTAAAAGDYGDLAIQS